MKQKPHKITYILLATLCVIIIGFIVQLNSPTSTISFLFFHLPAIILFFVIAAFLSFALAGALTDNFSQALLGALFITSYLLLRLFHITHWFFILLLVVLLIIIEFAIFSKD